MSEDAGVRPAPAKQAVAQAGHAGPLRLLASFRHSWRSKLLISIWSAIAVWVWVFLFRRDANLIFSVMVAVAAAHSIIGSLESGAGRKLQRVLVHRVGRLCFLIPAATAFVYSSLLAGDWGEVDLVPYACLGRFHLHHWAWALGQITAVLFVLRCETPEACLAGARLTARLSLGLGAVACACALGWPPANYSFMVVTTLNMAHLGMLSILLRSSEATDRWAGLFTTISLGVLCGIFANGLTAILRDFATSPNIPDGLIFFGSFDGCPYL